MRRRAETTTRGPSLPVALLTVGVGAVLIGAALTVLLLGRWDDQGAENADGTADLQGLSATASPSTIATALAEETTDEADGTASSEESAAAEALARTAAEAREALVAVPGSTTCSNVYEDAAVFHDYATANSGSAGGSADQLAVVTLQEIADSCDEEYARQLGRYIARDPQAERTMASAIAAHLGIASQIAPAPSDAQELDLFRAGDVRCTLSHDGVGCSVLPDVATGPAVCDDGSGRFSVAVFHGDYVECPGTVDGGSAQLAVGESAAIGQHACTVEAAGTVHCWSTTSGNGFRLSAQAVEHVELG